MRHALTQKAKVAENSQNSPTLDFLKNHSALAATIGYLYLTFIGMTQSWMLYFQYRINIFEFSELNDFLLAAFRDPLGWLAVAMFLGYFVLVGRLLPTPPRQSKIVRLFKIICLLALAFLPLYYKPVMGFRAESIASKPQVSFTLRRGDLVIQNETPANFFLIGATEKFVFVFDRTSERPIAIPTNNLVAIAFAEGHCGGECSKDRTIKERLRIFLDQPADQESGNQGQ